MRIYLVQNGHSDALRFLRRLGAALPPALVARAELQPFGEGDPGDAPDRVIALLDAREPNEVDMVRKAVETMNRLEFSVRQDRPTVEAASASADAVEGLSTLMPRPRGLSVATLAAQEREAEDLFKEIMVLFEYKGPRTPFPEESYSNAEQKAYDHIVSALGTEPRIDRGQDFEPGRIRAIKRPPRVHKAAWAAVVDHLEEELLDFRRCRDWLGETGHIQMLRDRQKVIDMQFLTLLDEKYLNLGDSKVVELGIGAMVSLSLKAISWIPDYGSAVSGVIGALWQMAIAAKQGPDVTLRAKIAEMEKNLNKLWVEQMSELERQLVRITSDWYLLSNFGGMIASRRLVWPDDRSELRRTFSHAYQLSALRDLLRYGACGAKAVYRRWEYVDKKEGEGWVYRANGDFDYCLRSQTGKSGEFRYFYYIGWHSVDVSTGIPTYYHASNAVQRKLFATGTSSETDPELAIHARFLTQPNSPERAGWGLPQR